ncbi:MAG: hypothetical protein ACREBW_00080, partial [Candidatus Micrarchaeaceae archaeon]
SSIVAPLMQQYQQTILPSIMGKFGQSAGSAFSSDQLDARQEAANNLETNIASAAGQLGLGAAEANQSATLGGMESGLFDAPSTLGLPQALTGAGQSLLSNLLQNSLTPYNIASASDTASYQNYLNQQKQSMNLLQTMLGYSTAPTMQTNQVVNSGQASLLSTILGNPGVGQGIGSLLSSAFGSSGGSSAAASGVGSAISSAGSLLSSFFQ